jgi:hypothetical protein
MNYMNAHEFKANSSGGGPAPLWAGQRGGLPNVVSRTQFGRESTLIKPASIRGECVMERLGGEPRPVVFPREHSRGLIEAIRFCAPSSSAVSISSRTFARPHFAKNCVRLKRAPPNAAVRIRGFADANFNRKAIAVYC